VTHFSHIIGHEAVVASLSHALKAHTVSHAYIFEGEQGIGKKTLAKAFAKAANCEGEADSQGAACACLSCRVFESGNHPDTFWVKGTNKASIGADDVRDQIVAPMSVKPFRYRYKIFITDNAHDLTPAAQNALLKTIEEPAPYGLFLFLTRHTHTLLPTVLSRCVTHRLKPLPDEWVQGALSGLPADKAAFFAKLAHGSIGLAQRLATSEDCAAMYALSRRMADNIGRATLVEAMAFYKEIEKYKEDIYTLLDILYMCVSASCVDVIIQAKKNLQQNAHFQMCMEVMLLAMREKMR
jgi:DNA polymerase-3 subunit delta'